MSEEETVEVIPCEHNFKDITEERHSLIRESKVNPPRFILDLYERRKKEYVPRWFKFDKCTICGLVKISEEIK